MKPSLALAFICFYFLFCPRTLLADEIPASESGVQASEPEIRAIVCEGAKATSCEFIAQRVYLNVGDRSNPVEIENSILRLKKTELFHDVQVFLRESPELGGTVLVIQVQERTSAYASIEGALISGNKGEDSATVGEFHVGERNLFGLGKRLDFEYTTVLDSSLPKFDLKHFAATYEDPNLFGSRDYFGSLTYRQSEWEVPNLNLVMQDYEISFGKRIYDFSYVKISHRITKTDWTVPETWRGTSEHQEVMSHATSLEYGWNTKDDPRFPTSGSTLATGITFPQSANPMYYLASSYTKRLGDNYYLNLEAKLQSWKLSERSYELAANFDVQLARYWTIHRQGHAIPDKLKAFVGLGTASYGSTGYSTPAIKTGLTYLLEGFGEISFYFFVTR
jgi:outer membrane protein assembly factor BamA